MEKDVDVLNGGERRVLQGVEISVHVSMRAAFVVVVVVVCVCVCVGGGGYGEWCVRACLRRSGGNDNCCGE
jgi:hypothetical protein